MEGGKAVILVARPEAPWILLFPAFEHAPPPSAPTLQTLPWAFWFSHGSAPLALPSPRTQSPQCTLHAGAVSSHLPGMKGLDMAVSSLFFISTSRPFPLPPLVPSWSL